MGASSSTNIQKAKNEIITSSSQSCPKVAASNVINWSGVKLSAPPNCPGGGNVNINQAAVVDATCVLSSLQKAAADAVSKLDATAKAKLGFSSSANVSDIQNTIKNQSAQSCVNQSTTNAVNWNDVHIDSCNLTVTQNATANTSCQIEQTQDIIAKIVGANSAYATGGSLLGDIFGDLGDLIKYVVAVVIIIVVLAGCIFAAVKLSGKHTQLPTNTIHVNSTIKNPISSDALSTVKSTTTLTGGALNLLSRPLIVTLLFALVVIIILLIIQSSTTSKQWTPTEVAQMTCKLRDARMIAGIDSPVSRSVSNTLPKLTSNTLSDQNNLDRYYQPLI